MKAITLKENFIGHHRHESHFGDKNSNERDVLGHFTSAGIVRDRIGIHADEIGKAAYTEARTLKLSEEFSVRHFTISSYTVFDVP